MDQMIEILNQAAAETVGYRKNTQGVHFYNDPVLQDLSVQRHNLRLQLLNNNTSVDRSLLRTKINRIQSETKNSSNYLTNPERLGLLYKYLQLTTHVGCLKLQDN